MESIRNSSNGYYERTHNKSIKKNISLKDITKLNNFNVTSLSPKSGKKNNNFISPRNNRRKNNLTRRPSLSNITSKKNYKKCFDSLEKQHLQINMNNNNPLEYIDMISKYHDYKDRKLSNIYKCHYKYNKPLYDKHLSNSLDKNKIYSPCSFVSDVISSNYRNKFFLENLEYNKKHIGILLSNSDKYYWGLICKTKNDYSYLFFSNLVEYIFLNKNTSNLLTDNNTLTDKAKKLLQIEKLDDSFDPIILKYLKIMWIPFGQKFKIKLNKKNNTETIKYYSHIDWIQS